MSKLCNPKCRSDHDILLLKVLGRFPIAFRIPSEFLIMAREESPTMWCLPPWLPHMKSWSEHIKLCSLPWSHLAITWLWPFVWNILSLPTRLISSHLTLAILYQSPPRGNLPHKFPHLIKQNTWFSQKMGPAFKALSQYIITHLISNPPNSCSNYMSIYSLVT